jgi:mono/diheme cytochrome c family protein
MRKLLVIPVLALALYAADTKSTAPPAPKVIPWEKNHLLIGKELYRANCVVCHDVDKPQAQSKKFGPSFYQLFKSPKMPLANMPPNVGYIKLKIKLGGAIMPSFAKTLNDSEMDLIIDYLQSL